MTRFLKNGGPTRTLTYVAVLVVLIVVFVVQEAGQPRRNAIPVPAFDADAVSQVRISGPDGELTFRQNPDTTDTEGSIWLMGDENYPVAAGRLESLLEEITSLERADIVTVRGNPEEYGLGEASRRTVRIFTGNLEPVALQLGDTAAAGNAVYGRVNTSREIVLLPRSLDTAVSTDPMRFRETTMVSIPEDRIVEARIILQGRSPVVVERVLDEDASSEGSSTESAGQSAQSAWTAEDPRTGEPMQADVLNAFVRELSSLQATAFPEYLSDSTAPMWTGDPVVRILVETVVGEPVEISLWPGDEEQVPARTSASPYDFFIPRWRAQRLMLNLE